MGIVPLQYVSAAEARALPGLRLALTAYFSAPWSEAAKSFFRLRSVPFVPVEQIAFDPNSDLVAWTGVRNAPVAMYEDEPARSGWLEILMLAERIGSGASLLPDDAGERALCLGLCTEIASEEGLGWTCRMLTLTHLWGDGELSPDAPPGAAGARREYRYSAQGAADAPRRIAAILANLSDQLASQRARNSEFLIGDRLSAADVLWAHFSAFLAPPPHDICPMPEFQRDLYQANSHYFSDVMDRALLEHRDRMLAKHLGITMDF